MKGILFKPAMIRAIVNGQKTQTRRLVLPQPKPCTVSVVQSMAPRGWISQWPVDMTALYPNTHPTTIIGDTHKAAYMVGETLYIKESWCVYHQRCSTQPCYKEPPYDECPGCEEWGNPMWMPTELARYFIEITGVRAEKLQEIKLRDDELAAEGIPCSYYPNNRVDWIAMADQFQQLWDSINKQHRWGTNPWVWVYTFKRVTRC